MTKNSEICEFETSLIKMLKSNFSLTPTLGACQDIKMQEEIFGNVSNTTNVVKWKLQNNMEDQNNI